MVTAIYSLFLVHGSELWLLFWFACVVLYLGVSIIIRHNRTKNGIKNVFVGLVIAEVIIDVTWAIVYYHSGSYYNYGIGGTFGLLLWIPVLVVTLLIVTAKNKKCDK